MDSSETRPYDADYYANYCGKAPQVRGTGVWEAAWGETGRGLVATFQPQRTLDVGCGFGFLVDELRELGVDAYGLDVSEYAIGQIAEMSRPFVFQGDALDPMEERFDVVTCLGVAEHLPESDAGQLIKNLCDWADEVVFASGLGDHSSPYTANAKGEDYWRRLFAANDFYPVLRDGPTYFPTDVTHFRKVTRAVRVAVFTRENEDWAVVRLRLLDPLRYLEENGRIELTVVSQTSTSLPIEALIDADVWVIHREFADVNLSDGILEAARLMGKIVVFEIDDLVTHLPKNHLMHDYCSRVSGDVLAAAREADFVTGTTSRLLADLAAQEPSIATKARVMRNVVNVDLWGTKRRVFSSRADDPFVVGWIGSMMHDDDLAMVKDAITYLRRKHGDSIEFHFYGYVPASLRDIPGVRLIRTATASYGKYVNNVRESFVNVGIAPLVENAFNNAKSDIKWLEYSIAGIPGIFSRVAAYEATVRDGVNGILVDNTTDAWIEAIERMMGDEDLRDDIATRAHKEVLSTFTVANMASEWDDAYRAFLATGPGFSRMARIDVDSEQALNLAVSRLLRVQGRHQMRVSNHEGAAASYDSALELDPGSAYEVLAVAHGQREEGNVAYAAALLESVVRFCPESAQAILDLANLHKERGDSLQALRVLENAEELHPHHHHIAVDQMSILRDQGDEKRLSERLRMLLDRDFDEDEIIGFVELCLAFQRPGHALDLVERFDNDSTEVDLAPLHIALKKSVKSERMSVVEPITQTLKVGVLTNDPLHGFRFESRIGGPFRAIEALGRATIRVSDGVRGGDVVDWADVVVIQGAYAFRSGSDHEVEKEVARAKQKGTAIVYELDELTFERLAMIGDPSALGIRDDIVWIVNEADAVSVSTTGIANALATMVPSVKEKIHVIPTALNPELWGSSAPWQDAEGRPFHIGLFGDWARPNDVASLIEALGPLFSQTERTITLTTWSSRVLPGSPLANDAVIGSATPFYCEYVGDLSRRRPDLALVPVSNDLYYTTLSDSIWAELAIRRVPGIYTARAPFHSIVENGVNGLLLGDRLEDWSSIVENCMKCPELRQGIADHAWNQVLGERIVQTQLTPWTDLLDSIATRRASKKKRKLDAIQHEPANAH